jgi:arginine decarboxylase
VNAAGHVQVHPTKEPERGIDLKELIDRLQLRGISLPVLVRFTDILKHRLGEIHTAFQAAIAQHQYQGSYSCVYPIKVNQQRQVVEEVLNFGRPYKFGLEAGSKPELLAVMALADNDTPIICNGFKDAEYIETAMLALKIGRNIIPVVEKYTELGLILEVAEKIGVRPQIGMRVKLAARGSGRWQSSGGFRSKFGLSVTDIMRGLEELKSRGMQDCLKLLAFPPRQPDHQHPHRQRRPQRGGPRVRGARQARGRPPVSGCRRRPRRRLRRLARPTSNRA